MSCPNSEYDDAPHHCIRCDSEVYDDDNSQQQIKAAKAVAAFYKNLIEIKASEHVKDTQELQGVIKSLKEEINRLNELLYGNT